MDELEKSDEQVRLRRFAILMGLIFFVYTCGGANFESEEVNFLWLGKLNLENFWIIKALFFMVSFYALGIFFYRECLLKPMPFQVRSWFKKYGIIVEVVSNDEVAKERDATRDLIFSLISKNPPFGSMEATLSEVPSSHLKDFMISLTKGYFSEGTLVAQKAIDQVLEKYFPFVRRKDLAVEDSSNPSGYKRVSIKNLSEKTTLFLMLEDFVYFLPTLPYALGVLCLSISFFF